MVIFVVIKEALQRTFLTTAPIKNAKNNCSVKVNTEDAVKRLEISGFFSPVIDFIVKYVQRYMYGFIDPLK